jgi:hypothetical protein
VPAADDAELSPTPPVELDARGNPVLPYAPSVPESATSEIEYAQEAPPTTPIEYAEATEAEPLEYGEGFPQAPPSREALARQGPESVHGTAGGVKRSMRGRAPGESPQRFQLELGLGPYVPAVDRGHTGDELGPYATIYGPTDDRGEATGQPKPRLFTRLGFEWQFVYLGGPLSVGTSIGFFRDTAQALVAEPEPGADTIRSSADKTSFNVIPVALLLGYRFELVADRFNVPLVPFAKGGLAYGFWWSTDGNGKISENEAGEKGRGGNVGWQVDLGMMLRLDFVDRGSARELDRGTGINHTYLFGEYQIARLNDFGTASSVDVGDDTWLLGLAF